MIVVQAQNLGRLDVQLLEYEAAEADSLPRDLGDLSATDAFNDHITHSYLWVLGTYELIRTLDQRVREHSVFAGEICERIGDVKRRFARIRVPLAKHEPARGYDETDQGFPWPAYSEAHGIGWRVAEDTVVGRKDLADLFLELLESIPETL